MMVLSSNFKRLSYVIIVFDSTGGDKEGRGSGMDRVWGRVGND